MKVTKNIQEAIESVLFEKAGKILAEERKRMAATLLEDMQAYQAAFGNGETLTAFAGSPEDFGEMAKLIGAKHGGVKSTKPMSDQDMASFKKTFGLREEQIKGGVITEADDKGVYGTSYCNQGHRLADGKPVNHECYVLDPKKLAMERDGKDTKQIGDMKKYPVTTHKGIKEEAIAEAKKKMPDFLKKKWKINERDFDPKVGGGVDRDKLKPSDFAGKHRSYPIVDNSDVKDALESIGRAGKDNYPPDVLKKRILALAKRKGLKLPKKYQNEK